jgi:uncharacterized protein (TIGR02466 family)
MQIVTQKFFASPIWSTELELEERERLNHQLMAELPGLMAEQGEGVRISNVGGWQSKDLRGHPILRNFMVSLTKATQAVTDSARWKEGSRVVLNSVWINVNRHKDGNQKHVHGHSSLSGVYYIQVPENSGNLFFEDPRPAAAMLSFPFTEPDDMFSGAVVVEPRAGVFVMFPSWMPHGVEASTAQEERVSIAYNFSVYGPGKGT